MFAPVQRKKGTACEDPTEGSGGDWRFMGEIHQEWYLLPSFFTLKITASGMTAIISDGKSREELTKGAICGGHRKCDGTEVFLTAV